MAKMTNASTKDLALTIAEMFITHLHRHLTYHAEGIIQSSACDGDLYESIEYESAMEVRDLLDSPRWTDLGIRLGEKLELWLVGLEEHRDVFSLGDNDQGEEYAKGLIKLAFMMPLTEHPQHQVEAFMRMGTDKKVAFVGSYLPEAPQPGPAMPLLEPITFAQLQERREKVTRDSLMPILEECQDLKQLAPGGLFE